MERLRQRFLGTILGGAIGDALGFPFEGSSRAFMSALPGSLVERFASHRSGFFPPGQYTDDTQMTLATIDAILAAGCVDGQILSECFMELWRDHLIVGPGEASTEAIQRLLRGEAGWEDSGAEPGRAGNGCAMRAAPIGLWNYDDPEGLVEDSRTAGVITHKDPRATAGMAAVAAAVAYNVTASEVILGDFIDRVADAAGWFHPEFAELITDIPRYLSLSERDALPAMGMLGFDEPPAFELDGITPYVVPTVLSSFYCFLKTPFDYGRTVERCLRAGGDVDTTASIAGSLSGALNGPDELPRDLLRDLLDRGEIERKVEAFFLLKVEKRRAR